MGRCCGIVQINEAMLNLRANYTDVDRLSIRLMRLL
ncbi:hypothetical protein H311_00140 [Anncaliia algerae PRA109]|nr:hypothetical protein H311_00140 [Anncaliia algerae PRA109]